MSKPQTIREHLMALPDEERKARLAMLTEYEWLRMFELDAFPHQLPPNDIWRYWNLIGPPRSGLTTAGMNWFIAQATHPEQSTQYLALPGKDSAVEETSRMVVDELEAMREHGLKVPDYAIKNFGREIRIMYPKLSSSVSIMGMDPSALRGRTAHYLWVDNAHDANAYVPLFPMIEKAVFTRPNILTEGRNSVHTNAGAVRP